MNIEEARHRAILSLEEKQSVIEKRFNELTQQFIINRYPKDLSKMIETNNAALLKCHNNIQALRDGLDPRLLILDVLST